MGEEAGCTVLVGGRSVGVESVVIGLLVGVVTKVSGNWQARLAKMSKSRMARTTKVFFDFILPGQSYQLSRPFSTKSKLPPSTNKPRMAPAKRVRPSLVVNKAPTRKAGRLDNNVIFPQL